MMNIQLTFEMNHQIYQENVYQSYNQEIYEYFAQKLNVDKNYIYIKIGEFTLRRGFTFHQLGNELQVRVLQVYIVNQIISQLENEKMEVNKLKSLVQELKIQIEKLEIIINSVSACYRVNIPEKTKFESVKLESQRKTQRESSQEENEVTKSFGEFLKHKKMELEKLQRIHQYQKINSIINDVSVIQEIKSICQFCNLQISESQLETLCQHNYHKDCFDAMIQTQIHQKKCFAQCICKMKIPNACLIQFLDDYYKSDLFIQQFLQNQIETIKDQYQNRIKACNTNQCPFFYIQKNITNQKSFCPNCLM